MELTASFRDRMDLEVGNLILNYKCLVTLCAEGADVEKVGECVLCTTKLKVNGRLDMTIERDSIINRRKEQRTNHDLNIPPIAFSALR